MTDRELLELAAKAYWGEQIGDVVWVEWSDNDNAILYTHCENQDHNGQDVTLCWNPLTDDGDAFRLAVKLGLSVSMPSDKYPSAFAQEWHGQGPCARAVPAENDPYAATRRAIVGTAAYIGKYPS